MYDITTIKKETGETISKSYHTDTFFVFGGKFKIRRAIENKNKEIRDLFENDYNIELKDLKIKRLYIDDIGMNAMKRIVHSYLDIFHSSSFPGFAEIIVAL